MTANLVIKDTGYIKTNNTGTRYDDYSSSLDNDKKLKGEFKVNSGDEITLKSPNVNFNIGANADTTVTPTTVENASVTNSVNAPGLVINGVIEYKNNSQTSTDEELLKNLSLLVKSKGYKELYYTGTSSSRIHFTEVFGAKDEATIPNGNTTHSHIPINVIGFTLRNRASDGTITYTLNCELVLPHIINSSGDYA